MIGQLAASSGVSVRTLRFCADAGVLPEAGRTASGYRVSGPDAVARARLVRTLRELGVGLDDSIRVLAAEASLVDVAAGHARALDAQIRLLRLQRAVLRAFARSPGPEGFTRMTDLTNLTADERRPRRPRPRLPRSPRGRRAPRGPVVHHPRTGRPSPIGSRRSATGASPAAGPSSASSTAGLPARPPTTSSTPGSGTPGRCGPTPERARVPAAAAGGRVGGGPSAVPLSSCGAGGDGPTWGSAPDLGRNAERGVHPWVPQSGRRPPVRPFAPGPAPGPSAPVGGRGAQPPVPGPSTAR